MVLPVKMFKEKSVLSILELFVLLIDNLSDETYFQKY